MGKIEQMPVDIAKREITYRMANVVEVLTRWVYDSRQSTDELEKMIEQYKDSREQCKNIDIRAYDKEINQRLNRFPELKSIPRV